MFKIVQTIFILFVIIFSGVGLGNFIYYWNKDRIHNINQFIFIFSVVFLLFVIPIFCGVMSEIW